jgi:hypothetical protein
MVPRCCALCHIVAVSMNLVREGLYNDSRECTIRRGIDVRYSHTVLWIEDFGYTAWEKALLAWRRLMPISTSFWWWGTAMVVYRYDYVYILCY